ncbi:MAG TPA: hypothetical protein VER03_26050 [Bryobacteraceae bacterium]|nr:hypothetical protein [Bryobacteraceae bacterium]
MIVRTSLLVFAVTLLSFAAQPSPVRIRLYNLSGVSASDLDQARAEVSQIYSATGITFQWEEGDPEAAEARRVDFSARRSAETRTTRPAVIVARIVEKAPPAPKGPSLGLALPFGRTGVHVTMYKDNIAAVSQSQHVSFAKVLGHALAHEIGHMLMTDLGHSPAGLMRATWGPAEYRSMVTTGLRFAPREVQELRSPSPVNARLRK